ncbi:MAG TPA: sugar ABC transporter substrate-binding protein [Candidatus Sulfotelmatobacter sp.]|nr:sugar ABC transporter substrate-binding protein [Candidatus Sulfotelmatobacter sp.]
MTTRYSRRDALALVAAGGVASLTRSARAAGFDWKRFSGTQLHFMVSIHPWTDWAQKQLAGLEAATGIKVTWEILYEDQLRQKLPLSLRADPGAVDGFFTLPSWDAAAFSRAKWYAPLDPFIHSDLTAPDWDFADFFPNILKIHSAGGAQIGVPITIELQTLFYNKALLQAKNVAVPRTLDEMMAAAKALDDRKGGVSGYVTRGDGVQAVYTVAPFLFAFGGRWLDDKGNPELGSAAFVSALKYYGDILRAAGPPNIVGMQWKASYPLFEQARAAMFTDATNFLAYFKDPSQSKVVDQVGVATLPAGPGGSHSTVISWGPAIAASSKHKEATWYAIQYLTSKAMQAASTEATHLPPSRKSIYDGDVYTKSVPADMIAATKAEIANAVPNGANPLVVPVPEVRAAIGTAIVSVLQGGDAAKAANAAQKQVVQILKG